MRSLLYRRVLSDRRSPSTGGRTGGGGSSSTGGRTGGGILINGWKNGGGDPHQRVEEQGGDPHERDPHQVLEMVFCSSEMEMKSKISIIMKTGFRPL